MTDINTVSSSTPATINTTMQRQFRVTQAIAETNNLPHASAQGTLGQINNVMQVRSQSSHLDICARAG
jgi:hypothetical protein